jgi:hypothetical protein
MWKLYKSRKKKQKQIVCHEFEPNPSKDRAMHGGDNPSFWDEFIIYFYKKGHTFFLIFLSISTEVRTYWAGETLGDLQSTSRGLDPGVRYIFKTKEILNPIIRTNEQKIDALP